MFVDRFQSGEIQEEFRKIRWKPILMTLALILLMLEIYVLCMGVLNIMSGYHSFDLAQDVRTLTYVYGGDPSDVGECNLGGDCFDLDTTYRDGVLRMFRGIKLTIAMTMMITATMILILIISGRKGK